MPQNAGKHVTESFKFQNFPGGGGACPRTRLEGRVALQHAVIAMQAHFNSATY